MAKAKARLLPGGVEMVLNAASGLDSWSPTSFLVGDAAGFTMQDSDANVQGNVVFVGSVDLIDQREISVDTTLVVLTIPEGIGPINVGNIMLYASSLGRGVPSQPFAEVVCPFAIIKPLATYDGGTVDLPAPGSRLMVSINLNHKVIQPDDPTSGITLAVTVVAPEFSSLPYFDNESNLPAPNVNPWSQFVVNTLTKTGGPGLVTRREDNSYWVLPFAKNIHHPKYHVFSGGASGDGYQVDRADYLWGGRFSDAASTRRGTVGGIPFKNYKPVGPRAGAKPFSSFLKTPRN